MIKELRSLDMKYYFVAGGFSSLVETHNEMWYSVSGKL